MVSNSEALTEVAAITHKKKKKVVLIKKLCYFDMTRLFGTLYTMIYHFFIIINVVRKCL